MALPIADAERLQEDLKAQILPNNTHDGVRALGGGG
jgi:hypothetical protein